MACYAKITITGRLVREPKQSSVRDNTVINFSVAVLTTKKEGDKYVPDYYNVNYWGKPAENVMPKLAKGALVNVYGDLTLEEYTDKSGVKQKSMTIRATDVIALSVAAGSTAIKDGSVPF